MSKCKKCNNKINKHRIHLGYSECTKCSTVKKYSSHTIYPHKTGGYIQPVSEEQSQNLNRLDRRGVGGKVAKGIISDNSWDRYLKKINEQVTNWKRSRPAKPLLVGSTPTLLSFKEASRIVFKKFDNRGYDAACELTHSLYTQDKINLQNKSNIMNELASLQMMTSKQRKFFNKIKKST